MNRRLDNELVERKLFLTRSKAQIAIKDGIVFCDGKKITKSGYNVNNQTLIEIKGKVMPYVSKGGLKLECTLREFNISLDDKIMLDIGSSTGGFTDCALQNGIKKVVAIDVGTDQFDKSLLNNTKIELYEQTDFRNIDLSIVSCADIATIDVSFISVKKMLPKINEIENIKEVICLIKPQFECGKDNADKYKGIILNKDIHEEIINSIIEEFLHIGLYCNGLTSSPVLGGSGNIEYLAYFNKYSNSSIINIRDIINKVFKKFNIV